MAASTKVLERYAGDKPREAYCSCVGRKIMAIRRIIKEGDDTLRRISRPVKQIDKRILTLLDDMRQTMYVNDGCGLAAPQVGILRRVVVVDVGDELYELINPEIIESSGEIVDSEGCLSVPGRRGKVARPRRSRCARSIGAASSRSTPVRDCLRGRSATRSTTWTAYCTWTR